MVEKRRSSGEDWARVFSAWRKSGGSQRGYCAREGISYSAFTYWRKRLEVIEGSSSLVRVGNLPAVPEISRKVLTVKSGGLQVELTGCESEELLLRVFRALKAIL